MWRSATQVTPYQHHDLRRWRLLVLLLSTLELTRQSTNAHSLSLCHGTWPCHVTCEVRARASPSSVIQLRVQRPEAHVLENSTTLFLIGWPSYQHLALILLFFTFHPMGSERKWDHEITGTSHVINCRQWVWEFPRVDRFDSCCTRHLSIHPPSIQPSSGRQMGWRDKQHHLLRFEAPQIIVIIANKPHVTRPIKLIPSRFLNRPSITCWMAVRKNTTSGFGLTI